MVISPATLNRIARKVGPSSSESVIDIKRSETEATPYGAKEGVASVIYADIPARFQYIGDYLHTGSAVQGLVRIDADVIISAAATADLRPHDIVVKKSLPRENSRFYNLGQYVISEPWNNLIYLCVTAGNTSSTPPVWLTERGSSVTDGTVTWRCEGPCQQFTVTELLAPRTYGDFISKQAYAKFRQDK